MEYRRINIGRKNATFQQIVALKENRNKRYSRHELFLEGVHNIKSALKHDWKVKHWIYPHGELSNWAKMMISHYRTIEDYCLSAELLNEISERTDKSELMAIFEMKHRKVFPGNVPFILVCDRISKKGNLGTIIRSADAFGCDGIIVTGHSVDIYDPEVIRASMGSFFAVDVEKRDDNHGIERYLNELKAQYPDLKIVATTETGEIPIRNYDFTVPLVLLIGNETRGLSKFYLNQCDTTVKIPMVGEATSFNVANAASIFLYEAFTQRQKIM